LHFPTRDELLAAAVEEFGGRVAKRLHELVEERSGLKEMLRAHLEGLVEFEQFYMRLVTQGKVLPRPAQNAMVVIQSAISFHLSQAVELEIAGGKIRRMPFHLLFNTWLGLLHYYIANQEMFAPKSSVLKRHGVELLEHFLRLIELDKEVT
jgi:AcrR family transcriptional regulator